MQNKNKIAGAPAGRISKPGVCCQNLQQMPGFFVSFFFTDFPGNRLFYKSSTIRFQESICQSLDSQVESGTVISVKDEAGKVITEIKTEVTLESNYTEL